MSLSGVRLLGPGDLEAALGLVDRDPVADVFVRSRLDAATVRGRLDRSLIGGELWGYGPTGELEALCFHGASVVPVAADEDAVRAFAARALTGRRRAFSLFGPADAVLGLWELLEPRWGPARELRADQPLLAIERPPAVEPDPRVRLTAIEELETVFPASVAMFTEEVGVSPTAADGGAAYRGRLRDLIREGRSYVRIEDGRVVFKAEVGCASALASQIQGVWVPPDLRGRGLAVGGMAAVVELSRRDIAPIVSLYVNDFNTAARVVYERVGFQPAGTFATVLL